MSAKDNQKLLKLLIKEFERSVYCNGYKTKNENKNATNVYKSILTLYLIAFCSVTKCIPEKAFVQTKKNEHLCALFTLVSSWKITFFLMEHNEMISAIKWFSVQFYYCEHNVILIRIVLILFLSFVFISNELTTSLHFNLNWRTDGRSDCISSSKRNTFLILLTFLLLL